MIHLLLLLLWHQFHGILPSSSSSMTSFQNHQMCDFFSSRIEWRKIRINNFFSVFVFDENDQRISCNQSQDDDGDVLTFNNEM